MTKKIAIFETENPKKKLKFTPLKVNKIRSPCKPFQKSKLKGDQIVQSSSNISKFDQNLHLSKNTLKNINQKRSIPRSISSKSSNTAPDMRSMIISSSSQNRWQQGSTSNLSKISNFNASNRSKVGQSINEIKGSRSSNKLVKKVGNKQPNIKRFLTRKVDMSSTKEISNQNEISQKSKALTDFVNSSENSDFKSESSIATTNSADRVVVSNVRGDSKETSKVYKLIDVFETNFMSASVSNTSRSDSKSKVDLMHALKNNVGGKKRCI